MEIIDRKQQPTINTLEKISLLTPSEIKLDNGIPLYSINAGTQDVIRIECIFDAGTWYQEKTLVAFSTIKMLTEGTKNHSASELAEIFDSHGAFIETETDRDYTFITMYSLNKHLEKLLPVLAEMMIEPLFPEHELKVFSSNKKQEQLVSMQKVNYLSRIHFTKQLFGKEHPYGIMADAEDYEKVTRNDLVSFHKKMYHPTNLRIVISGKINDNSIKLINKYLGNKEWQPKAKAENKTFEIKSADEKINFIPKENALQSGIRLGKILFTKKDSDYFGMYVLNTILGGYFGSRLMSNIREDKGYTYGIGSGIMSMKNEGYLYIASEVGADVREDAIKEIYKEIELLKQKKVSKNELDLVKNYMIGAFLRDIDGPFALSERFTGIFDYGFDFNEYFQRYITTVKNITPKEIINLANKYFEKDSFYETIVGK